MSAPGGFRARHLAVVGLGLMGGSAALALRPYADTITGVDPSPPTRDHACAQHIVDAATEDLRAGVADADVVLLAAPVRTIVALVRGRLGSYLRANTLVVDMGSVKQDICEALGTLPVGVGAVGGHPMTGKERSGVWASDAALWQGRPFVLCPTRRTTPAALDRAHALVAALGAVAVEMDAARHDKVVAAISHLPYLLSTALVATVAGASEQDADVWRLAAGGFRDTSRLAGSDVHMMTDILSTNTQAVATVLALFRMELAKLEALLLAKDHDHLAAALRPTRAARLNWERQHGGPTPHDPNPKQS